MTVVDTNRILFGSDQKVFDHRYEALVSNYNDETASEFFESYKNKPLLFILKNAEKIIKEPKFGTDFFMNIIESGYIPFHLLVELETIVKKIIADGITNKISEDQKCIYTDILNRLEALAGEYENTIKVFSIACNEGGKEFLEQFYDYLYEIKDDGCDQEFCSLVDTLFVVENPFVLVSALVAINTIVPQQNGFMIAHLHAIDYKEIYGYYGFYNKENDIRIKKKFSYDLVKAIKMVSKDESVLKSLDMGNINVKYLWNGIVSQYNDNKPIIKESGSDHFPIFSSSDLLDRMITESQNDSQLYEESNKKIIAYEHLTDLYAYYESMKDMTYRNAFCEGVEADQQVIESFTNAMDEIGAKILMLEWTDNGEPDSVIKQHIMTQKQIDEEKNKKQKEKDDAKKASYDSMQIDDEDEEIIGATDKSNLDARNKILRLAKNACTKLGILPHTTSKAEKDFTSGNNNEICLGSFKPEDKKKLISEVKSAVSEYLNDLNITEENYNTIYITIKSSSDYYMEATAVKSDGSMELVGEEKNTNNKPEKPKEDFPTKVQNKAIDHAAKRSEKKSIRKEKLTKIKNAGKAVASGPMDDAKEAKGFLKKFGEWDIKRRKEFFLKPGYRHKIFRNIKHALMYGIGGISHLPHLLLIRHFSKDKDRRLRNELIRELDAEIRITEEKINDANSAGDQQEKYKLMRIKEKLSAEKNRVQVNSKYI